MDQPADMAKMCRAGLYQATLPSEGSANRTPLTRASLSPAVTAPDQDTPPVAGTLHAGATRMARRAVMLAHGSLARA
jgi:hypothetical protein